ncbi:ribokinase [Phenylobacterium sp.]|jgi:ribokinase|uniref:ribokinase n=1 Tax=Phenylobacterium sp. TaxID=1871053 RepID=UPI002E34A90C|nr:ribokinase [Phenylobacterium sp.]HEX2559494.1 ribokinase [Phenylobacterium sp.]
MTGLKITIVGSINLDFVAQAPKLPTPGETVTGAQLARHPGGKGANQALAARRLGAEVALVGRVGEDAMASEALALLRAEGVDLSACATDSHAPTGVALIAVSPDGENQIVVASGANAAFTPHLLPSRIEDALVCQLELPIETVAAAVQRAAGFVCLNLAPAADVPEPLLRRADLVVVNETEAAFYGESLARAAGLVAVTYGRRGAELRRTGDKIAEAHPPQVEAVDSTGAGDAFVAALTLALLEGRTPEAALAFACAAGALAATRPGAQPSLPRRDEVEACLAGRSAP